MEVFRADVGLCPEKWLKDLGIVNWKRGGAEEVCHLEDRLYSYR